MQLQNILAYLLHNYIVENYQQTMRVYLNLYYVTMLIKYLVHFDNISVYIYFI